MKKNKYLDAVSDDEDQGLGEEETQETIMQVGVGPSLEHCNCSHRRHWEQERQCLLLFALHQFDKKKKKKKNEN